MCLPSAPKTFLNKHTCVRQTSACLTPIEYSRAPLTLNSTTLRAFFTHGHRFAYQVHGLRLEAPYAISPCAGGVSRWRNHSAGPCAPALEGGVCAAGRCALDAATRATIVAALNSSSDTNKVVRDVKVSGSCTAIANNVSTTGAFVTAANACWEHVHPELYDVWDFTYWTEAHPNMQRANSLLYNPISFPAGSGMTMIAFPGHHAMSRWSDVTKGTPNGKCRPKKGLRQDSDVCLTRIGRFGDTVVFADLPTSYQTTELAELAGATAVGGGVFDGSETCGSPGEVASDAHSNHVHHYWALGYLNSEFINAAMLQIQWDRELPVSVYDGKNIVWTNMVFAAKDQLRQRMAWALSQIYVVAEGSAGTTRLQTEIYVNYYDIFVRNAFGNLRDVLREVAYSPMMGEYLTYVRSKSLAASGSFPDENFSREFMELFSIGLYQLNQDGSRKLDANGDDIQTFTNVDVMNFARVWTGFNQNLFRPNFENRVEQNVNKIDPMAIDATYRDALPKANLYGGYLGDGYPLCNSLPSRTFLRQGAGYSYRGTTLPESAGGLKTLTQGNWGNKRERLTQSSRSPVVMLAGSSALRRTLCAADASGACDFPSEVKLTTTLPCVGVECRIDTVRVIGISIGANETVYYQHIPAPCVFLAFYDNAKQIKVDYSSSSQVMCADPTVAVAGAACCPPGPTKVGFATLFQNAAETGDYAGPGAGVCEYTHEMVTFATAQQRCQATRTPVYVDGPWLYDSVSPFSTQHFVAVSPDGSRPSECLPKTLANRIKTRCCSDTRIVAQAGDKTGQTYKQQKVGNTAFRHANCSAWAAGRGYPDGMPWTTSKVVDFAQRGCDPSYPVGQRGCGPRGDNINNNNGCLGNRDFEYARDACAADGARLCTQDEVENGCAADSACGYNDQLIWTNTSCTLPQMRVCPRFNWIPFNDGNGRSPVVPDQCDFAYDYVWMDRPCQLQAQVDSEGMVSIVHGGQRDMSGSSFKDHAHDDWVVDSGNAFRASWRGGSWPSAAANCSGSTDCAVHGSTCLCNATVRTIGAYTSTIPSAAEAEARLHIGAAPPHMFDAGTYMLDATRSSSDVEVWTKADGVLGRDAIIRITNEGKSVWRANIETTVSLGGSFNFRNPPHFVQFHDPTTAAAEQETEVMIDHMFNHPNTAPFISHALVQRFTTSNPSPRYITAVAAAFRAGRFDSYGSGRYGDLEATVAAILLDREARSETLGLDATHGLLREPIIKVMHLLRSMEYRSHKRRPIYLKLTDLLGQEAFRSMSVFNFYKPDFAPAGSIGALSLVSPEAELYTTPFLIGYLNGIRSLVIDGLTSCNDGFGPSYREAEFQSPDLFRRGAPVQCPTALRPGSPTAAVNESADGHLAFVPTRGDDPLELVSELDLLLTGGRLDKSTKSIIVETVNRTLTGTTGYFVSMGQGLVQPNSGAAGTPSFCAEATERHEVICCSSTKSNIPGIAYDDSTVGTMGYGQGNKYSSCAALIAANPSAANNQGTKLFTGSYIADEDVPRTDRNSTDTRTSTRWIDPDADDDGWEATRNIADKRAYACLHSRVHAVAQAACAADGARVCSLAEIEASCGFNTGCGHNTDMVWTSTPCTVETTKPALRLAQQLVLASAEFSATNAIRATEEPRPPKQQQPSQGRPYRATVLIYLDGGLDSFNVLVPHSNCHAQDMYAQYAAARGATLALPKASLRPISIASVNHTLPCSTWGVHPELLIVQQLFQAGDAAFIANIGSLIEPLSLAEYKRAYKRIPTQLYSHNTQTKQAQSVHPQYSASHGVLGRMVDALRSQPSSYRANAYSIAGSMKAVEGQEVAMMIDRRTGITRFAVCPSSSSSPLANLPLAWVILTGILPNSHLFLSSN